MRPSATRLSQDGVTQRRSVRHRLRSSGLSGISVGACQTGMRLGIVGMCVRRGIDRLDDVRDPRPRP